MAANLNNVKQTLINTFKDAKIELLDETGDGNHLSLQIISDVFKNMTKIQRHKLIYKTLHEHMSYIHALSIKAETINGE